MQILVSTVSYCSMESTNSLLALKKTYPKGKNVNKTNMEGQQVMNKNKTTMVAVFYRFFNVIVSSACEHLNLSFD